MFCQAWSGSKLFDTLMVTYSWKIFLKNFILKKYRWQKSMQKLPSMQRVRVGRKIIHHGPVYAEKGNLSLGVVISTRHSASLAPDCNSYPSGEISLSCMDTHDGVLYSWYSETNIFLISQRILIKLIKLLDWKCFFSFWYAYYLMCIFLEIGKSRPASPQKPMQQIRSNMTEDCK